MENKKIKFPIAIVFYFIIILHNLMRVFLGIYNENYVFFIIFEIAASIFMFITLIKKEVNKQLFIATVGIAITKIIQAAYLFFNDYSFDWMDDIIYFAKIQCNALSAILLVLIIGTISNNKLNKYKYFAKKLYFLRAILTVFEVFYALYIFNVSFYEISFMLCSVSHLLATFFLANWCFEPYTKETIVDENNDNITNDNDLYIDLVKHILLSLFTFGIWMYIWIYKKTTL